MSEASSKLKIQIQIQIKNNTNTRSIALEWWLGASCSGQTWAHWSLNHCYCPQTIQIGNTITKRNTNTNRKYQEKYEQKYKYRNWWMILPKYFDTRLDWEAFGDSQHHLCGRVQEFEIEIEMWVQAKEPLWDNGGLIISGAPGNSRNLERRECVSTRKVLIWLQFVESL